MTTYRHASASCIHAPAHAPTERALDLLVEMCVAVVDVADVVVVVAAPAAELRLLAVPAVTHTTHPFTRSHT